MNSCVKSLGFLCLLSVLFACTPGIKKQPMSDKASVGQCVAETDLECRMDAISHVLGTQGFTPLERNIRDASELETTVEFDQSKRIVIVAIGDHPAMNINLAVFDKTNNKIAADTTADSRAVLSFVADKDWEYTVELDIQRGIGRHLLEVYTAEIFTPPVALNGFFDADPVARIKWQDVEKRMFRDGFEPHHSPQQFIASRQNSHDVTYQLDPSYCYSFAATGSAGIDRLNARLESQGRLLVVDVAHRPHVWVRYCPEQTTNARLEIGVEAGSGTVTWGSFASTREQHLELVGPLLHIQNPTNTPTDTISLYEIALNDLNYGETETLLEVDSIAGSRFDKTFSLKKNECAVHYVITDIAPENIDTELTSGGKPVQTYSKDMASRTIDGICATEDSTYQLRLFTLSGNQNVRVYLKRLAPIESIDIGQYPEALFVREAISIFDNLEFHPMGNPVRARKTGDERKFVASLMTTSDKCHGIAVVSSTSLHSITVSNEVGNKVSAWQGNKSHAVMAFCPTTPEVHEIQILTKEIPNTAPVIIIFESEKPSEMGGVFRDTNLQAK